MTDEHEDRLMPEVEAVAGQADPDRHPASQHSPGQRGGRGAQNYQSGSDGRQQCVG